MPPYLIRAHSRTAGVTIFDLQLMVVLGAIDLNVRYRILDAELSEGYVDLFFRLQTYWGHIHSRVSTQPWLSLRHSRDTHIGSYFVYEGMDESGVPHIHFMRGEEWRNKLRFITRYLQ